MIKFNGIIVRPTIFPDGTSQVWKLANLSEDDDAENHILWEFEDEAEIFHLAQLVELVKLVKVEIEE